MRSLPTKPDVAVIGAGPVGCVTALAFARQGARVLLLEAHPQGAKRLAGEWLHPPGVEVLERLGVGRIPAASGYPTGSGFAVFPDDGTEPIELHYPDGLAGFGCEHGEIVSALREAAASAAGVYFLAGARVTEIEGQRLSFETGSGGETRTVSAERIVGADGRSSVARKALGIKSERTLVSYMAGVLLEDVGLPFEGFGHVFLGGPGPVLAYRIGERQVRICLDVPARGQKKPAYLWDTYSPLLPAQLLPAFREALSNGTVAWVANQHSSRTHYGREGLALVGDATGHFHPMTATGMTVGFLDAECLVRSQSFEEYRRSRTFGTYVPEMLATTLHQVFAGADDSAVAIRKAVYRMWRENPAECRRTMRLLSGAETNVLAFSGSFLKGVAMAVESAVKDKAAKGEWREMIRVLADFPRWVKAPAAIALSRLGKDEGGRARGGFGQRCADRAGFGRGHSQAEPGHKNEAELGSRHSQAEPGHKNEAELGSRHSQAAAGSEKTHLKSLRRGVEALVSLQGADGSWEGEVVWCPMLAAQYALMCWIVSKTISPERREALLLQFAATRLPSGLWGLHSKSEPYLFVTALVYVAARILGVEKDSPLLVRAGEFIREQGGVIGIPTWGKFWLAMLNLYDWRGVNPVLPEAWLLPQWLPAHPKNFYCHTRLIYMPMGFIYGRKFQVPVTPLVEELRSELYAGDWQEINFSSARGTLRAEEVYTPPTAALQIIYKLSAVYENFHAKGLRESVLADMIERIRWELQTTDYTSISPVSGLLNIIALWLHDPTDEDLRKALDRFDGWIWQDERAGLRVTGARSSTWDTAFAVQALLAASRQVDVSASFSKGQKFLATQQIRESFPNFEKFHRSDPKGGFCFAGVWHGWPVSDCTAEALVALLDAPAETFSIAERAGAVRFLLRCQNKDGGFGSYERRNIASTLEWMNPAEMFGNSMTEHSYIECAASCVEALREFRHRHPEVMGDEIEAAIQRAGLWLRRQQEPDGSWPGFWGVNYIYGTMFGIRGLLAAGGTSNEPAVRKACRWLASKQRSDGGWGEHFRGCLSGEYVEHSESQVIQTAWAMIALLLADAPDWEVLERGADFLAAMQLENGEWPEQDWAGVFFHTALLDYTLYRSYFPVWALGLYCQRTQYYSRSDRGDRFL